MAERCALNCEKCYHNDICKIKSEYEKFTMVSVPDFITVNYGCAFWSSKEKEKPRKMPNFDSTNCDYCVHKDVCSMKERITGAMKELDKLRNEKQIVFQGIGIRAECRRYIFEVENKK